MCESCKASDTPDTETLAKLGLNSSSKCFKDSGCDDCLDSGYKGRIAIAECLTVDKTIREMIQNNSSEADIADYAFKDNESIDQASKNLITVGITSCDEILRVNNMKEDGSI